MKLTYLAPWDVLILTALLFGPALVSSMTARRSVPPEEEAGEFTLRENVYALVTQALQLALACGYLWVRKFDFGTLSVAVTPKSILAAAALFCAVGLLMDLITSMKDGFGWIPKLLRHNIPLVSAAEGVDLPLVLISVLNGFYEEFFFLGICTAVAPQYGWVMFLYAIAVRILIHTYQGLFTAVTMGLNLGLVYGLLYAVACDNLFVYAAAHALADIFGLSLFNLL